MRDINQFDRKIFYCRFGWSFSEMVHIFSALKVFEKVLQPVKRLSRFGIAAITQKDYSDTKFGKVEKIVEFICLAEFCDIHWTF